MAGISSSSARTGSAMLKYPRFPMSEGEIEMSDTDWEAYGQR